MQDKRSQELVFIFVNYFLTKIVLIATKKNVKCNFFLFGERLVFLYYIVNLNELVLKSKLLNYNNVRLEI